MKKTHIRAFLLFSVALLVFALPGFSQETGKLKGFILKADGKKPLFGAQVLLKNMKTGEVFESNVTDALGDYKLIDVPEGDYMIHILVKDKSYKVKKVDFQVKVMGGRTTSLSFALKKKPGFFLFLPPCLFKGILAGLGVAAAIILL